MVFGVRCAEIRVVLDVFCVCVDVGGGTWCVVLWSRLWWLCGCGGGGGCGSGHSMGCVVVITQANTPFGLCVLVWLMSD